MTIGLVIEVKCAENNHLDSVCEKAMRQIINEGHSFIESRTCNMKRTDIIVDYRGEQYIGELKIWRGQNGGKYL